MSHLDRTGAPPEDQPAGHQPGIHCANGWQLGHTLDDDRPLRCIVCHPEFLPDNRRRRLYGASDPGPTPGHQPHPENPSTATPDGNTATLPGQEQP